MHFTKNVDSARCNSLCIYFTSKILNLYKILDESESVQNNTSMEYNCKKIVLKVNLNRTWHGWNLQ